MKVLIFLSFFFLSWSPLVRALGHENDPCTPTTQEQKCATLTTFLTCVNSTCQCSSNSIWSTDLACVLKAGQRCQVDGDGLPTGQNCRQFSDCEIVGSGPAHECHCMENTTNIEGACQSKLGYSCDNSTLNYPACDLTSYLTCQGELCQCQPGTIEINGECKSKIYNPCNSTGQPYECDSTSFLTCDLYCQCQPGTSDSGNGVCRAEIDQPCLTLDGSTPDCVSIPFLKCDATQNLCKCQNGALPFDEECRLPLGGTCGASGAPPCNYMSECNDSVCSCVNGTNNDGFGLCRVKAGQFCSTGKCDSLASCIRGTCECLSDSVANGNGFCRIKLNFDCQDNPQHCDDGAECGENGRCGCRAGAVDNGKGKCRVGWEGDCGDDMRCDEEQLLECGENNKCGCQVGYTMGKEAGDGCSQNSGVKLGSNLSYYVLLTMIITIMTFVT